MINKDISISFEFIKNNCSTIKDLNKLVDEVEVYNDTQ